MDLEVHVLQLGDVELESSFLVQYRNCGVRARVPTHGFLILGNPVGPILVDTGYRSPAIMERLGMGGIIPEGYGLEPQLAEHGLDLGDIKMILHTHLHIDHGGCDDLFPMSTPVVVNRRELEIGAASGAVYPPEDIKHLIDRFHTPGAMRVLDLADSGPVHVAPGVRCELTGGHTEGSMNVLVETAEGTAVICGDVVYDIHNQLCDPFLESRVLEPQLTGNRAPSVMQEKGAIKRALESGAWLLPGHDQPARIEWGQVVGRVEGSVVPGPATPVAPKEFAAVT
jgi:glyoxylase-like metal-dependent hydrolase (beta-lactamase superfamily II)